MARFGAVLTAMVTPFDESGALDLGVARELARWLVDRGNDGLVVAGTTGEAPVLTDDEKVALWQAVRESVSVPVVAGTGSNDTHHTVELTRRASEVGVDGVLVVTPYYNRPGQAGLEAHFRAAAEATSLPVLIYDIPIRTGRKVDTEVLLRLGREVPNIVGVKDAAGDPSESARLIAEAPSGFELYSGDDSLTLPLLSVGAVGVIGVATHWAGIQHGDMIGAFHKGDVSAAREINARLIPSYDFETSVATPNPIPAKAMMRTLGFAVGECRLPMGPAPEGLEQRAREVYAALS
jgi:4-hydroxy-tetrahydrodipicolinate synthase